MTMATINALERRIGQRRGATRAPTQAPEWRGAAPAAPRKSAPPVHNLLPPKNGLDNGVHFTFLNAQEGRPPARGERRVNPEDGLTYVWIPPGTFTMGCSPGDRECLSDEKPAHQV